MKTTNFKTKGAASLLVVLLLATGFALAQAADQPQAQCEACTAFTHTIKDEDGVLPLLKEIATRGFVVRMYGHPGSIAKETAGHERVASAIVRIMRAHGLDATLAAAPDGTRPVIEIESSFHVYTHKFSARRVFLTEFATGQAIIGSDFKSKEGGADVFPVFASAAGIKSGFTSSSFRECMVCAGTRNHAPVPEAQRFERGEQEVVSKVRIVDSTRSGTFVVLTRAPGDMPPYKVDALTMSNWGQVATMLSR